jgi:DNA-binding transcriptional LysR family regulator
MVAPSQAALVARKVGDVTLGLFATEEYLAPRPAPSSLVDLLRDHVLIGDDRERRIIGALAAAGVVTTPGDYGLRTDSDLAQLAAIRAGIGVGVCQRPIAARARLRRVLPEVSFSLGIWLVMHVDLRAVQRIRVVFDHLAYHLGAYARSQE